MEKNAILETDKNANRQHFNDGSHIIYVNGNYQGSDDIGHLIRDFHTKLPEDMYFKELADSVQHFKETEKGRDSMSEAVRKFAEEYAKEYAKEYAETVSLKSAEESRINTLAQSVKMLMQNTSVTMDQAFSNLGISDSDQILIKNQFQVNADK